MTRNICSDPQKELERRRKISEANKGRHHSEETRRKISQTKKGKISPLAGRPLSEETRQKMSVAKKGKHYSDETRQKMSIAHKGVPLSEETRSRIRYAAKLRSTHLFQRKIHEVQNIRDTFCSLVTSSVLHDIRHLGATDADTGNECQDCTGVT